MGRGEEARSLSQPSELAKKSEGEHESFFAAKRNGG
jgi:hypothetical protein